MRLIGFKSRGSFLQYCPKKPTKWGLNVYVLADSETGYILNKLPYTGGETRDTYLSQCNSELPLHTKVVVALFDKYLDKGHHVYADRYYSSVNLVDELDKRKQDTLEFLLGPGSYYQKDREERHSS